MSFKYTLAKGSAKDYCPKCGSEVRKKTFKRYVDTETGEQLPIEFGRCNREESCGYFNPPTGSKDRVDFKPPPPPKPISKHPESWLTHSLQFTKQNNLYQFLITLFDPSAVSTAFARYQVGTIWSEKEAFKAWNGSCVFWLKNRHHDVLAGKVMQYTTDTGKRAKNALFCGISWLHSLHRLPDWNLGKCLFGEHLLNEFPDLPIAIVESEKTALVASMCNDQYLWLATGGKGNIQPERFIAIADRKVVMFPDFGAEAEWITKNVNLQRHLSGIDSEVCVSVNNTIAGWYLPPEFQHSGMDVADYYILKRKYPKFDPLVDFHPFHEYERTHTVTKEELYNFMNP